MFVFFIVVALRRCESCRLGTAQDRRRGGQTVESDRKKRFVVVLFAITGAFSADESTLRHWEGCITIIHRLENSGKIGFLPDLVCFFRLLQAGSLDPCLHDAILDSLWCSEQHVFRGCTRRGTRELYTLSERRVSIAEHSYIPLAQILAIPRVTGSPLSLTVSLCQSLRMTGHFVAEILAAF